MDMMLKDENALCESVDYPGFAAARQSARSHAGADEARAKALWPVIAQCQDWLGCLNCVSSNACFSSLHKRLTAYLLNC
jgi:hypothetical protein